jgi:predicted transcriptional regulator
VRPPSGLVERALGGELGPVEEAAGARLKAETDGNHEAVAVAADALLAAATSAMAAGYPLSDIAAAEERGKLRVRGELRGDALKLVERTGRHVREANVDHHRAIARAVRLGLSMREIAHAAGVTHGTIRAISNRLVGADSGAEVVADEPPESSPAGEAEAKKPPISHDIRSVHGGET